MAACNTTTSAKLTRFIVRITEACGPESAPPATPTVYSPVSILGGLSTGRIFTSCIKATGLSLGEEGTITVPQWGVNGILSDGQRTISALGLDFRVESNVPATPNTTPSDTEVLVNMFSYRSATKYDIDVAITGRDFKALFIYKYKNCDFRSFKSDDQEIGAAKLGTIMTEFLPLEIELYDCANTKALVGATASTGLTWAQVTVCN